MKEAMSTENKVKLFLVDDDKLFLKSLEIDFQQNTNYTIETFTTGERCIAHLNHVPDIIILDYNLDGIEKNAINGIETLDRIKESNPDIPVIMLSSQDNIDIAISSMHHSAVDYVMKNKTSFIRLEKIISTILSHKKLLKELN